MKRQITFLIMITIEIVLTIILNPVKFIEEKRYEYDIFEKIYNKPTYQNILNIKNQEQNFINKYKTIEIIENNQIDIENGLTPEEIIPTNLPEDNSPVENQKIQTPITILVVGDSLILEGFGPALDQKLSIYKDVTIIRKGEYSTGLNRTDYFDWYAKTAEYIEKFQPDILIIMIGANDGQNIRGEDGKIYSQKTSDWDTVYTQRVNRYLTENTPKVKHFYWVGHPITNSPDFLPKFTRMNKAYQDECAKFENSTYINSWDRFSVNGKYSAIITDDNGISQTVKASDGVHLTDHGGNVLADLVIQYLYKEVELIIN